MPVEGLPDLDKHRACIRCLQWFEPEEGALIVKQRSGMSGAIADSIRGAAGEANLQFICHRCASFRRKRKLVLYALIGLALVWAIVKESGWL
jgi:hypothetical protein